MGYEFDSNIPIYLQLRHYFRMQIVFGQLAPGERMPPVREIAVQYGINPNTVQRALTELEEDGLAYSQRTAGRFITEDRDRIAQMRQILAKETVDTFIKDIRPFGFSLDDIIDVMKSQWSDDNASS